MVLLPLVGLAGSVWWVQRSAQGRVYRDPDRLPAGGRGDPLTGLVLGTSRRLRGGGVNPHFTHRIEAAARLYRTGRVDRLLVSGNGQERGSREPADMRRALGRLGVPAEAVVEDPAGLRTLDSVVRARRVFGLRRVVLVTDPFHAARAVFLARHAGLEAWAFGGEEVPWRRSARTRVREWFADARACLDVYLLGTGPGTLVPPAALPPPSR